MLPCGDTLFEAIVSPQIVRQCGEMPTRAVRRGTLKLPCQRHLKMQVLPKEALARARAEATHAHREMFDNHTGCGEAPCFDR